MFTSEQREEIIKIFAQCFHEVVVPMFENLATKEDIAQLERKLDKQEDRMDRHGKTLDNYQVRIEKLETKYN